MDFNSAHAQPPIFSSLAFGCLLGWISLGVIGMDQPWQYEHTPFICVAFLAGVVVGFAPLRPQERSITSWHVVSSGLVGAAANAMAAVCPFEPVEVVLIMISNALPGVLARYWAWQLVTAPKNSIMPFVAVGGLVCSALLLPPAAWPPAAQLLSAFVPLLGSVFMHMADMRGESLGQAKLERDMHHASWPLPTAIVICTCLSSCFVGLLSYPFLVISTDVGLFAAVFGIFLFAPMAAWSTLARRRNVNGFLIVTMFALEMALLAFSAGIVERVYLPIAAIAAVGYAVSVLVWVLAAFLSRSQNSHAPYQLVFALCLGCGTGALGRGIGFVVAVCFKIPFSSTQTLAAVLLAVCAIVLVVLSGVELVVMRNGMESRHANDVAAIRIEAAREVEGARTEAAQQVADVKHRAQQEVDSIRMETAKRMAELMSDAEAQMQAVLSNADERVAAIREQASVGVKMSIRESCQAVAERYGLTDREAELIYLICDGMSRAEVARKWVVTENTVKYHLRNVYRKLEVHNSRDLIAFVEESRTVFEDDPPQP